jgi:peptidoglycan/LPS O-acetylase OafA/YrhL
MLHREWRDTGRIRFGRFYLRRFKRLTPALALMVAVTLVISAGVLSPLGIQQTAALTGAGAMFLVANVVIALKTGGYFDAAAHTNPLLHTWSLSVEEQFYLLFPTLIAVSWSVAASRRKARYAPQVTVMIVAALSFGLACGSVAVLTKTSWGVSLYFGPHGRYIEALFGFYSPVTRSWEFAIGVLLAMAARRTATLSERVTLVLGLVGAGMLAASLWLISETTPFPGAWTLIPVVGTLMLLAAGSGARSVVTRALSINSLAKIGDWSYSVYLWHWPFIVFAGTLWPDSRMTLIVVAVVSFLPAIASYYFVETPIRNLQEFQGWRATRVVTATLLVPLLICLSVGVAAHHGYWSRGIQAMQTAVLQPHAITGCPTEAQPDGISLPCVFNADAKGKPIFLVGDSTAWHFSEAAIGAAQLLGRPAKILQIPGCPFKDIYVKSPHHSADAACRIGYESAMRWLLRQPKGTVIISDLNAIYHWPTSAFGLEANEFETEPARRTQVLDEGLIRTIVELQRAGQAVLLVQAAPDFELPKKFDPLVCTSIQLSANNCIAEMSRSDADTFQQPQRSSLQKIGRQTGAALWDPREFFCDTGECSTQRNGINLYRDTFHISPSASRMLSSSLADALEHMSTSS